MNSKKKMDKIVLAVDIGGTKIAVGAITTDGRILSRNIETTLQKGPESGIKQIIALLETLINQSEFAPGQIMGIGVGIPAMLENGTDFIIWGPNLKGWKKVDLRGSLEMHFKLPVCVEYDGHTAVLGEWWVGAGKNFRSIVSVIIGTGIGGGMILDGNLFRGINRVAGAVGWFTQDQAVEFDPEKERALGSWEARTAGPAIARRAQQLLKSQDATDSILKIKGEKATAEDVFEAAKQGDPLALQIAAEEAELLGMGIANIVSLLNPEIIILGGSVGSNASFLLPQIEGVVKKFAQPISCQSVQIVTSQLGADAGLFGAAYGIMLRLKIM